MTDEHIWFNMERAVFNEEERRRVLKPYQLAEKIARLCGTNDGVEVYKKVRRWKRGYDNLMRLSVALDRLGEELDKRHKTAYSSSSFQCPVCGRIWDKSKHETVVRGDPEGVCYECRDEWRKHFKEDRERRRENGRRCRLS